VAVELISYASRSGVALAGWLASMVLIPVVVFYMLRDWDKFITGIHDLLPRHLEPTVSKLARDSDQMLGAFLRGQLTVMVCLGIVYSIGLKIAGLEWSLTIGMLAGLVSFVPYLGVIFGLLTASIAVMIQSQDVVQLVWVLLVFGAGQMLEGMILTPWLVGDRVGLHPVAVIFAVLAGGQLFGFMGILLALPVASVLAVLLRHARARYRESGFYGEIEEVPRE
jgi:predicted PurR-regulated permease PerM